MRHYLPAKPSPPPHSTATMRSGRQATAPPRTTATAQKSVCRASLWGT